MSFYPLSPFEAAYAAANSVGKNRTVEFHAESNEKREDAQARILLAMQGVVVVFLRNWRSRPIFSINIVSRI